MVLGELKATMVTGPDGSDETLQVWITGGAGVVGDPLTVMLVGEICTDTTADAGAVLRGLVGEYGPWLHLDLQHVSFIDARALTMLIQLRNISHQQGGELRLLSPGGMVQSLLQLTNLTGLTDSPR
jgi:anti-anti-sigma factor